MTDGGKKMWSSSTWMSMFPKSNMDTYGSSTNTDRKGKDGLIMSQNILPVLVQISLLMTQPRDSVAKQ